MRRKEQTFNPLKLLVFLLIGAVSVLGLDVLVLNGRGEALFRQGLQQGVKQYHARFVEDTIRDTHETYLKDGIKALKAPAGRSDREISNKKPSVSADIADVTEDMRLEVSAAEMHAIGIDVLEGVDVGEINKAVDLEMAAIMPAIGEEKEPENSTVLASVKPIEIPRILPEEPKGKPRVVIIIDDMGVSPINSSRVENLPAPLTLAYLPYAKDLPARTKRAKAKGHELMVHVPMQAMDTSLDGGPAVLKVGQGKDEFTKTLAWALSQFGGYAGINNHMGSRLTQDREAMKIIMVELKQRDVFFIDSKTIGSSVAAEVARETGVVTGERDVFLDHEISEAFVEKALRNLEAIARRKGYAIAIGHPHRETIAVLKRWIPTLAEKGMILVPASAVLSPSQEQDEIVSSRGIE